MYGYQINETSAIKQISDVNKMKLICDRYYFPNEVDLKDVNFFNDEHEPSWGGGFDLYPYLVRDSLEDTDYQFEKIDNTDQTLYIEASSKRFRLDDDTFTDIGGGQKLSKFFMIYEDSSRYRWHLTIFDDNDIAIFKGLIYRENVRFPDREKEVMNITAVGYEQEFKDFCANRAMQSLPETLKKMWGLTNFNAEYFIPMLDANLPDSIITDMEVSYFISLHRVCTNPYFYAPHNSFTNATIAVPTGYHSFMWDGIDFYTYFNSLLLSKGWVWYFYLGKLIIQERAALQFDELILDYNEVDIKHDVESLVSEMLVENIIIDCGEFYASNKLRPVTTYGKQYVGGNRKAVYNETGYDTCHDKTSLIPFYKIHYYVGATGEHIYETKMDNHKTFISIGETQWTYNFHEFHIWYPNTEITRKNYGYAQQKTLCISPVINSQTYAGGLDVLQARTNDMGYYGNGNFYSVNKPAGDYDFRYVGNPGMSLIRVAGTNSVKTYFDDLNGDNFKQNFKGFLRSNVQVTFKFDIDMLITDPRKIIKIINYPYHDINDQRFAIRGLSYHEQKETSTLKLQML